MVIVRTMQAKLWNGHFKIGEQAGWLQGWENARKRVCLKNVHEHGLLYSMRNRGWYFRKREMVNGCIRMD